ncbi:MAG TPA: glycosyltransferase [Chthoniobacterales bacterium]|jgi:glycosyltransferase involved in cell wall biosynthesis
MIQPLQNHSNDFFPEGRQTPRFSPASIKKDAPVVASYCVTFLKPEMQHVYRQITALRRFRPVILTQRRENEATFPYPDVRLLGKPLTHQIRRFWARSILGVPITAYRHEASRVLKEIRKMDAHLLHIYFGHMGIYLLPLLRRRQVPAVVSFHGADATVDASNKELRKCYNEVFELADLVVARSESLVNALRELGCPDEKLRLHRTGVSLTMGVPIVRTTPVDGDLRFVQASRLIEKKGLDVAIRAFATFAREFPMSEFIIAGEGPFKKRLENLAAELKVKDQVHFAGFLPQKTLHELYERSHVFVHPSQVGVNGDQEGVPNAMLEAMVTGMPVIATRHGGIPEAVEHGRSGLLVEEKNVEQLTEAFLALGRDGTLLQNLSLAASERVRSHFDRQKQARLLEDYYDEAIRRHQG